MVTWPQVNIELPPGYSLCFGCGADNTIGLKLKFQPDKNGVRADFMPSEQYQGWPGYLHGGIIGCLLDEAMSNAASSQGIRCVTARYEVRLKRLVPISEPLVVTASITKKTRKVIECVSSVSLKDGTIVAEGNATHFVMNEPKPKDTGKS